MAYDGYLIKVGNYKIPHKFIKAETYMAYKIVKDLDSYEDANGVLHRNALEHFSLKVEFETPPMLTNKMFIELMSNIQSNYSNELERKVSATVYIPETDSYITQDMYMPDIQPKMYGIFNGVIIYNSIRLAFIGY